MKRLLTVAAISAGKKVKEKSLAIAVCVAAMAAFQVCTAEAFPLPLKATAVVTNAAAVMEAKVFNGADGGALAIEGWI